MTKNKNHRVFEERDILMKTKIFLICGLILGFLTARADNNYFNITPLVTPPAYILPNQPAIAIYLVNNPTDGSLETNYLREWRDRTLPVGVSVVNMTDPNNAAPACGTVPFTLSAAGGSNPSCQLALQFRNATTISGATLNVCHTDARCTPFATPEVKISSSGNDLATLNINGVTSGNLPVVNNTALTLNNTSGTTQANYVQATLSSNLTDLGVSVNTSSCLAVAQGSSCNLPITIPADVTQYAEGTLTLQGANTTNLTYTLQINALNFAMSTDTSDQHMQYQAIKITNNTPETLVFNNISVSADANYVSGCTAGDPVCVNPCTDSLPAAGICTVWVKAQDPAVNNLPLGVQSVPSIIINTQLSNPAALTLPSPQYTADYDFSLYVSRVSLDSNSVQQMDFEKWNGSTWQKGINGSGAVTLYGQPFSLLSWRGDLYVGGGQLTVNPNLGTNPAACVASFNGQQWNFVDMSVLDCGTDNNGQVNALAVFNEMLYAGGKFAMNGASSNAAPGVAYWDGAAAWQTTDLPSAVQATTNTIKALNVWNNTLYAGVQYSSNPSNAAPVWKLGTGSWSVAGTGFTNAATVNDLAAWNNTLYAGGTFNMSGSNHAIASSDGGVNSTWQVADNGINPGSTTTVSALTEWKNLLYEIAIYTTYPVEQLSGSTWSAAGGSQLAFVNSGTCNGQFTMTGDNHSLYLQGGESADCQFQINSVGPASFVQWDGSDWSALPTDLSNTYPTQFVGPMLTMASLSNFSLAADENQVEDLVPGPHNGGPAAANKGKKKNFLEEVAGWFKGIF